MRIADRSKNVAANMSAVGRRMCLMKEGKADSEHATMGMLKENTGTIAKHSENYVRRVTMRC